jgi:hypothetical protein
MLRRITTLTEGALGRALSICAVRGIRTAWKISALLMAASSAPVTAQQADLPAEIRAAIAAMGPYIDQGVIDSVLRHPVATSARCALS